MEEKSLVSKIMDYESGNMEDNEILSFFKELVDTGMAWDLQGSYGRTAMRLIESGAICDMRC